jgi:hypothetical protein
MSKAKTRKVPLNQKLLWTEKEFCELTGLSRTTLAGMRSRGKITFLRPSGCSRKILYSRDSLADLTRQKEGDTAACPPANFAVA